MTNQAVKAAQAILAVEHDDDPAFCMQMEYDAERDTLAELIDKATDLPALLRDARWARQIMHQYVTADTPEERDNLFPDLRHACERLTECLADKP